MCLKLGLNETTIHNYINSFLEDQSTSYQIVVRRVIRFNKERGEMLSIRLENVAVDQITYWSKKDITSESYLTRLPKVSKADYNTIKGPLIV